MAPMVADHRLVRGRGAALFARVQDVAMNGNGAAERAERRSEQRRRSWIQFLVYVMIVVFVAVFLWQDRQHGEELKRQNDAIVAEVEARQAFDARRELDICLSQAESRMALRDFIRTQYMTPSVASVLDEVDTSNPDIQDALSQIQELAGDTPSEAEIEHVLTGLPPINCDAQRRSAGVDEGD